jgi:hypothetical protein
LGELGETSRVKATSAPEDAIASACRTWFALLDTIRPELIVSAHPITIALSKSSAQSARSNAAPASDFEVSERLFIRSILLNTVFVSAQ